MLISQLDLRLAHLKLIQYILKMYYLSLFFGDPMLIWKVHYKCSFNNEDHLIVGS